LESKAPILALRSFSSQAALSAKEIGGTYDDRIVFLKGKKVSEMLIDTHAHLDFPELAHDLPSVLERAARASVLQIITIGIDLPSSEQAVKLAGSHPRIFATVGIHPHGAKHLDEQILSALRDLARQERVVAIGEIGLDYYRDRQPRPVQRECLRQQLELAREENLPVVFHIRDAYEDFLDIVKDYASTLEGGIMHCFSGNWEVAQRCLDMGFYLSIPGTVTFSKAEVQQDVVRRSPFDRLLVETDAPFLAPVPFRGKDNEPSFVLYTAQKIAGLRGCTLDEVAVQTTANARKAFRLERWEGQGGGEEV
jgi:TatD DNase family protein